MGAVPKGPISNSKLAILLYQYLKPMKVYSDFNYFLYTKVIFMI